MIPFSLYNCALLIFFYQDSVYYSSCGWRHTCLQLPFNLLLWNTTSLKSLERRFLDVAYSMNLKDELMGFQWSEVLVTAVPLAFVSKKRKRFHNINNKQFLDHYKMYY